MGAETSSQIQSKELIFTFSNNIVKIFSQGLKISWNIESKCLVYNFYNKVYFHQLETFYTSCLSVFKYMLAMYKNKCNFRKSKIFE